MARMLAAEALWDLGDRRSVDPLMRTAEADPHEPTRWQANITLARFADDPKVQAMFQQMATQAEDARHRELALGALRRWLPSDEAAMSSRVAGFGALLQRCRAITWDSADSAAQALETTLLLVGHRLSDDDLRAVTRLSPVTAIAESSGPGGGRGVVAKGFGRARSFAGAELLHRWTLHPYWQWPWFRRLPYALLHGVPRRPQFSHSPLVAFGH